MNLKLSVPKGVDIGPADLVVSDARIDLSRGDPFMSQHLADRFQRYALRKRDRCGKGMPRHVDRGVE